VARSDLRVTIDADAAKLEREVQRAARSMSVLEREIAKGSRSAAQLEQQMNIRTADALQHVGRGMVAFGAATVAGLALATKAAIDWESAWAGVRKTVSGSPEELAAVEAGLRDLATTLPASHREIAAVAEAAGQLGIATDDVVDFTKIMVNLGETTNLTADEAATAIAQLMNIMQTAPAQVSNLGSALVALGNDGASTERDIIEMAQRIAGAAQIIGLTEAEVLGVANALASVGIEAEAGGTAISKVMTDMASAVSAGGSELEGFAKVAGVSAEDFARSFREEPAEAITRFVEGLGRINQTGGDVFGTLSELGLADVRVSRALLSMAGAGDLLRNSLELGNTAWSENNALADEAAKRYETTAAKMEVAKNAIVDAAISFGSILLPALAAVSETVADVARWFAELPEPVRGVLTVLGGVAGVTALAAGGFILLFPKVLATVDAFRNLRGLSPGVATGLGRVGKAAAVAGGAFTALLIINEIVKAFKESEGDMRRWAEGLEAAAGDTTQAKVQAIKREIEALDKVTKDAANTDLGFVNIFWTDWSGNAVQAADRADFLRERLAELEHQTELTGLETERAAGQVGQTAQEYVAANEIIANAFGLTGESSAEAVQSMLDTWSDAAGEFFGFATAYDEALGAKEQAERETAEATAAATSDASDSWEDFVGDVTLTVDEYLAELERQVQAQRDWEANLLAIAGRVPGEMLAELVEMGPAGAQAVALMADMTQAELDTAVEAWRVTTGQGADAIAQRLAEAAPVLAQIAREHGQKVAASIARGMAENGSTVEAEARRQGVRIDKGVGTNRTRRPPIHPELEGMSAIESALLRATRDRFVRINAHYAVSGGLPAGLTRGHKGGLVTTRPLHPPSEGTP
jgi:TP901 family phage tail tape measure protein